jgi:hypothetical protein
MRIVRSQHRNKQEAGYFSTTRGFLLRRFFAFAAAHRLQPPFVPTLSGVRGWFM